MKLCVFCSASEKIDQKFKDIADETGRIMAKNNIGLVFGGGKLSMMGAVASSVTANGGHATGYIPGHLNESEGGHSDIEDIHIVDTMHTRKMHMAENSDGFLVLPGGFGSMDEFFEIMTWKQLGIHHKPIIIMNAHGYWEPLLKLMDHIIAHNFARPEHKNIFDVIQTPDELMKMLSKHERFKNI
ncbi:MAG: TIGR00730 family Rossman fold protein [Alphaproteobacteria bacterium CG_4_10_14_0_8_um_filter_37_21]|nr:MAG: TIGR00730 family Rossman fold protein [Alphaproteobacteria bacterium CG_4_10_14_0_8_um_filter_37_21]